MLRRRFYLYKKFSEDGIAIRKIAESFVSSNDEAFVVTEHDRKFDKLDKVLSEGKDGDILIIETMEDIGADNEALVKRLQRIIDHRICLISCDMKATYTYGISIDMNQMVLETILEMLHRSEDMKQNIFLRPRSVGRPSVVFPDGWDEQYAAWKAGKLASKDFMNWSGMKKATFYNKLTQYKELLDREEKYRDSIRRIGN